jgi:thioredoxin 1
MTIGAGVLVLAAVAALWLARGNERAVAAEQAKAEASGLPRLMDIGSKTCIPCKMMEPVLEELKKEYAGKLQVDFIDVAIKENVAIAQQLKVEVIPTQIFCDAKGKELWRHQGFIAKADILAKWAELGIAFQVAVPTSSRMEPAKADARAKEAICYMCDGDIHAQTRVTVQTDKGPVNLCSMHCYFIMYSCLMEDKAGFEQKVSVTDFSTGKPVPSAAAVYLYGADEKSGRPTIKAFADRDAAVKERQASGGNITTWAVLQEKELSHRCGFCDRACYPEDSASVKVGGVQTWGCCSHCALGVAARTGKDIEVRQPDRLTGEMIVVKTTNGSISSLEPSTAVAWFGLKKGADGSFASAGCFHQGFFVTEANLRKWVEQNPTEVGKQITIAQALADKMKLTPQQIQKACKIGQCTPK